MKQKALIPILPARYRTVEMCDSDDFDKRVIRYVGHKLCVQEITQQTVTKLLLQLRYQLHFTGSKAAYKTANGLGLL
jgi:hypothetical protein